MDNSSRLAGPAPRGGIDPFVPLLFVQVLVSAARITLIALQPGGDLQFPLSKLLAIALSVLTCLALFLAAHRAASRPIRRSFALMGFAITANLIGNLLYLVLGLILGKGTGFSSFSYLQRLPVDILKIDQTFVAGLTGQGRDISLVEAILTLSRSLHLTTIAEGTEYEDQLIRLRELGCPLGQGYLLSRPCERSAVDELLQLGSVALNHRRAVPVPV